MIFRVDGNNFTSVPTAVKTRPFMVAFSMVAPHQGGTRSEGPGRGIFRIDPSIARDCECGCAQETGDHGAGNGLLSIVVVKVDVQRSSCWGMMEF